MIKMTLKIIGWAFLWLIFVWTFVIIGFPAKTAKDWLTDQLEKGLDAKVSIEELRLRWNLGVRLKGISITSQESEVGAYGHTPLREPSAFNVKLASLNIEPSLFTLIRLKPEIDFYGGTPSGGDFSGAYDTEELSLSFKEISFKDVSISTLPVPSAATVSGSGRLKLIKGKGLIEIEIDGMSGGKQRAKVTGGENPGVDGKLKVAVSLPKL